MLLQRGHWRCSHTKPLFDLSPLGDTSSKTLQDIVTSMASDEERIGVGVD